MQEKVKTDFIITNTGRSITMENLMHFIGWANQEQLAQIINHAGFEARAAIMQEKKFDPDLREAFKIGASDFQNYVFGYISDDDFQMLNDKDLEEMEHNPEM